MEFAELLINKVNGVLWGPAMLVLLLGTHLYFTFRLGFIQRHIFLALKLSVAKDEGVKGEISPFGALTGSLAATIGTGNIIGMAIAVTIGGPGAILWCWFTGVFGMATKYAEVLLAIKYREITPSGHVLGGPMYTLKNGLKMKTMARLFCIFTALAAFGLGNTVPANAVSGVLESTLNIPTYVTGVILSVVVFIVIVGGVKSIARVSSALIPFMSFFYIIGCIVILVINHVYFIDSIILIFKSAFTFQSAGGGFIGSSVMLAAKVGITRGLYSNESGMGSAPILAAAARSKNPVRQGLVSMTGTFWDTVIICPLTGLVLVCSVIRDNAIFDGLVGGQVAAAAFGQIPYIGHFVLNVGLVLFAFSTILGWVYYGEKGVEYLFGKKGLLTYRLIFCVMVFVGSVVSLNFVWGMADAMNALMALPNLLSLILLSGVVISETKKYMTPKNIELVANSKTFHHKDED